ncbi:MAG: hypothetical protein DRH08_15070 [Deltaproteobacteria bacterium]|nr:MAG: hypothetical protein DRH08_15070 [Deltaproteobacteria bacterium]
MAKTKTLTCGLIAPISPLAGCSAEHWEEVRSIVADAIDTIDEYKFNTTLVSDADEVGVIQKRIVQNVYNSDMIVCDVSGKNPNVMFELGLRLAFDKATIIIKDDETKYSFDTGIIEHITYPRDLRFTRIVDFKKDLARKFLATYEASVADTDHSPFLKNFGKFKVADLNETEVPADKIVLEALQDIRSEVGLLRRRSSGPPRRRPRVSTDNLPVNARIFSSILNYLSEHDISNPASLTNNSDLYRHVETKVAAGQYFAELDDFMSTVDSILAMMS